MNPASEEALFTSALEIPVKLMTGKSGPVCRSAVLLLYSSTALLLSGFIFSVPSVPPW
jgi:hypothetical protein